MEGKITITRDSRDIISIRLEDTVSGIEFAEVKMTPAQFAMAITGLACQRVDMEVRWLEHVGKRRVTEPRSIVCPLTTYDRHQLSDWLRDNAQEEGWIVSTYLGSQSSIQRKDGVTTLHYHVTKYVDLEPES